MPEPWTPLMAASLRGGDSSGTFTDISLNYHTAATVVLDQALAIKIVKIGGAGTVLDFDNVRLSTGLTPYAAWQILHYGSTAATDAPWGGDPAESSGDGNVIEFRTANAWALEVSKKDHPTSFFRLRATLPQP